jgi:transposase-like protein
MRWYLRYPLSARQVAELLAERGIDVSARTVLTWVQTFGPLLAKETDRYRRRLGGVGTWMSSSYAEAARSTTFIERSISEGRWWMCSCGSAAILASAEAFFRRAVKRWVLEPNQVVSDRHQPCVKAEKGILPGATHIRTGLHRRRGETTKSIERSHVAIRDRLRCSRGIKSMTAGQRFLEGFEAMQALSRGDVLLSQLVPGYRPTLATHQQRVRAVVAAMHVLGARLTKAA